MTAASSPQITEPTALELPTLKDRSNRSEKYLTNDTSGSMHTNWKTFRDLFWIRLVFRHLDEPNLSQVLCKWVSSNVSFQLKKSDIGFQFQFFWYVVLLFNNCQHRSLKRTLAKRIIIILMQKGSLNNGKREREPHFKADFITTTCQMCPLKLSSNPATADLDHTKSLFLLYWIPNSSWSWWLWEILLLQQWGMQMMGFPPWRNYFLTRFFIWRADYMRCMGLDESSFQGEPIIQSGHITTQRLSIIYELLWQQ